MEVYTHIQYLGLYMEKKKLRKGETIKIYWGTK